MSDAVEALRTLLASRGMDVSALRLRADGTLGASGPTLLADAAELALGAPLSTEGLTIGELLGRGGMGEVRLATQASLRREVAVKTVLDPTNEAARTALFKEAWVGGALEHPAVVPVHTLARTEGAGAAAVVMKRIEGSSWATLLRGEEREAPRDLVRAREAHLRTFVKVCHAIAFAHEQGILHLDLKPENVMIGDLGEVYLVDWGLAAATDRGPAWLARASTMTSPSGTPAYMAPELASGEAHKIGPQTDLYLLGALLHRVVTGQVRHQAETLVATMAAAYFSEPPEYGPEIPRELARILTRAMQREPADRYGSADSLREAVEAFVRHRDAEHFRVRAVETLASIDAQLAASREIEGEIEALLSECEVALTQVERVWPELPELAGLRAASIERRVRHAIHEERPEAARALLGHLRTPPEALMLAVSELEARASKSAARLHSLEAMSHELDLTLGSRERRFIFGVFAVSWLATSLTMGFVTRAGIHAFSYGDLLIGGFILVALLVPYGLWTRQRYFQNRANTRLYGGLIFTAVAVELFWLAAWALDVPVTSAVAITPTFYAYAFGTLALALDRRWLRGVALMAVTGVLAALRPDYAYDLIGLGGAGTVVATLAGYRAARA